MGGGSAHVMIHIIWVECLEYICMLLNLVHFDEITLGFIIFCCRTNYDQNVL